MIFVLADTTQSAGTGVARSSDFKVDDAFGVGFSFPFSFLVNFENDFERNV